MPGWDVIGSSWNGQNLDDISLTLPFYESLHERGLPLKEKGSIYPVDVGWPPEADDNSDFAGMEQWVYGWSGHDLISCGLIGFAVLQQWVVDNCSSFVQSHDLDGTKRSPAYYNGKSEIEHWSFTKLMQSIYGGAAKTHFRRIPKGGPLPANWEDYDDPAYSYGVIQEGDIRGPWIQRDLQAAINHLIWREAGVGWSFKDEQYNHREGWTEMNATWGESKTIAEDAWADDWAWNPTLQDPNLNWGPAFGVTEGSVWKFFDGENWWVEWGAGMYSQDTYALYNATWDSGELKRDVYLFFKGLTPNGPWATPGTYDSTGISGIAGVWTQWDTFTGVDETDGDLFTANKIGNYNTQPQWCDSPTEPEGEGISGLSKGWVAEGTVILCFDREGGYTYY